MTSLFLTSNMASQRKSLFNMALQFSALPMSLNKHIHVGYITFPTNFGHIFPFKTIQ